MDNGAQEWNPLTDPITVSPVDELPTFRETIEQLGITPVLPVDSEANPLKGNEDAGDSDRVKSVGWFDGARAVGVARPSTESRPCASDPAHLAEGSSSGYASGYPAVEEISETPGLRRPYVA